MPRILKALLPSGEVDGGAVDEAVALLRAGRLVALPTETVYGLAADASDPAAVRRIFEAKGRPVFNPLIVHVRDVVHARSLAEAWPPNADKLATAFWPGPLTLVLMKKPSVPAEVTAGLPAVALRNPAHPVFRAVLERSGLALAAPSANRSNAISPTTAAHVAASLGDRVELILDGGPCGVGIESTVVDVTREPPAILRFGGITAAQVEAVVGPMGATGQEAARASPGQLEKHYAPNAVTRLGLSLSDLPDSARIGAVTVNAARPSDRRITFWEPLGAEPAAYARELYAALHRADDAGCTHILIERVPAGPEWEAVRDRLTRASTRD